MPRNELVPYSEISLYLEGHRCTPRHVVAYFLIELDREKFFLAVSMFR